MASQTIKVPSASRQIVFHQLLVAARKTWLMDALSDALGHVDPKVLKRQLSKYVPTDAQQILAAAGVRDEHVFPTPIILETKPTLVGCYRLLFGVSQKIFVSVQAGWSHIHEGHA
ncbi:MAG: XcyI family restriction endonuclease [Nitrospinae bacterium]|nr:XcyI family restriction endonuclease [Nitrospinota bacterium]